MGNNTANFVSGMRGEKKKYPQSSAVKAVSTGINGDILGLGSLCLGSNIFSFPTVLCQIILSMFSREKLKPAASSLQNNLLGFAAFDEES